MTNVGPGRDGVVANDRSKPSYDRWLERITTWLLLSHVLLLFAGGLILLGVSNSLSAGFWHDLIRDVAIAVIVASIVAYVIDRHLAIRREADVRSGILDAIMKTIVPPLVWDEIRSSVISQGVIRDTWSLTAVISKEHVTMHGDDALSECYIATGTLTYTLRNLLNKNQTLAIEHELASDVRAHESDGEALPRFVELKAGASGSELFAYSDQQLRDEGRIEDDRVRVPVDLQPSNPITIGAQRREIINVPGTFPWYMTSVTLNPTVTITTYPKEILVDVIARHPNPGLLQTIVPGRSWRFSGVLLPGQGLEIVCRKRLQK